MMQEARKITAVECFWIAFFGGTLTYAFTRLGFSALLSLDRWSDGLLSIWQEFTWILKTFPFFSISEIICFVVGALTASIAYYNVQPTTKYKQFLFFWISIATLIYSFQKIVAISKIPNSYLEEPQEVVHRLLWLNIYSLFCEAISFIFSLILVEYLFRRNAVRIHEI
ncbi:MAG: hypothetical protein RMJ46_00755, partial [Bacteroidota bacterium]|nr:hypothetical protein [Bacteroidota bacterium]